MLFVLILILLMFDVLLPIIAFTKPSAIVLTMLFIIATPPVMGEALPSVILLSFLVVGWWFAVERVPALCHSWYWSTGSSISRWLVAP